MIKGKLSKQILFFLFLPFLSFKNYEEINDNFSVSEYLS